MSKEGGAEMGNRSIQNLIVSGVIILIDSRKTSKTYCNETDTKGPEMKKDGRHVFSLRIVQSIKPRREYLFKV